jgi:hypothetical protein
VNNEDNNDIVNNQTSSTVDPDVNNIQDSKQPIMNAASAPTPQPQVIQTETVIPQEQPIQSTQEPVNPIPPQEPKGSGFKRVGTLILFAMLFAFVWFLPEITDYVKNYQSGENVKKEVTTGKLNCNMSSSTETLNVNINAVFSFENKKLKSLTHTMEYLGEVGRDEDEITSLKENCALLKTFTTSVEGLNITCNSGNVTNKVIQYFNYEVLNTEELNSAYVEAGGTYPEFRLDQNIEEIKLNMENVKYKCEYSQ